MSGPNTQYDPVEVERPGARSAGAGRRRPRSTAIAAAADLDELKAARLAHQGDKSPLALANREIGALPPTAKAEAGKRVGAGPRPGRPRRWPPGRPSSRPSATPGVLVRGVGRRDRRRRPRRPRGRAPPAAAGLQERIADIFVGMGWEVAEGPEVESEWFNFDALNFGPDHPARQMQDTFFVDPPDAGLVLRTHTSPVQVRTMLERELPIYVICPGKVFRTDELDATHTPVFHQVEGLAVDEGLTMAHLQGHARPVHRRAVRRGTWRPGCGRRTSRSPSPAPSWTSAASSAAARTTALPHLRRHRLDRVGRLRHGQPQGAAGLRHRPRPLQRVRLRDGHRARR